MLNFQTTAVFDFQTGKTGLLIFLLSAWYDQTFRIKNGRVDNVKTYFSSINSVGIENACWELQTRR